MRQNEVKVGIRCVMRLNAKSPPPAISPATIQSDSLSITPRGMPEPPTAIRMPSNGTTSR